MENLSEKKVALVGSGLIGSGWAIQFLYHGVKHITMYDVAEQSLERAKERIEEGLQWLQDNGVLTAEQHAACAAIPTYTTDLHKAVADADFILENVPENLEIKQKTLANIEAECRADAVISSSTSAIMIREIAQNAVHPERVIGAHPYLPVYLLPLVEIVTDEKVEKKYLDELVDFLRSVGKKPVVLKKDSPGYIGTRLMTVICREAVSMLVDGVCNVDDLDPAFTFGPGLRYALARYNEPNSAWSWASWTFAEFGYPVFVEDGQSYASGGDYGIRGLFSGRMNGGSGASSGTKKTVMETLCNWTEYPPEAGYYMVTGLPEEVDAIMKERGWTNRELMEFRDKGLLELLKYHKLV